ncbi:RMD2 protein, partial [Atractosteus spatula]|nr:RMD2 protein [Atractosteus spatula]
MSQPDSKALVLGMLAGAAGMSLAMVWYRTRKAQGGASFPPFCLSSNNGRHAQMSLEDGSGGAVRAFQGRQAETLDKLNALILCVSELKEEVRSLKEAIPRLQEQVREELRGKAGGRRASPLHRAARKKRAGLAREEGQSSEEAESEGGYVTAHTDTEEELDEEHKACKVRRLIIEDAEEEKDEFKVLIKKADSLHRGPESEKKEGFMMLLERKDEYGQRAPFLWRLARAYGDVYDMTSDTEDKKSYAEAGKTYGEQAITSDPMCPDSHQWFAIMCGYLSEYESVQNKIKNGYLFKVCFGSYAKQLHCLIYFFLTVTRGVWFMCVRLKCLWVLLCMIELVQETSFGIGRAMTFAFLFFSVQDHLDKAIELKPQDPLSYYLLGRWCYAVSQLSWIERKVAATLFGNPPTATIQDALKYFLKVEEICPKYSKFNYVFLAKCYRDLGQRAHALQWCNAASSMEVVSNEGSSFIQEPQGIKSLRVRPLLRIVVDRPLTDKDHRVFGNVVPHYGGVGGRGMRDSDWHKTAKPHRFVNKRHDVGQTGLVLDGRQATPANDPVHFLLQARLYPLEPREQEGANDQ